MNAERGGTGRHGGVPGRFGYRNGHGNGPATGAGRGPDPGPASVPGPGGRARDRGQAAVEYLGFLPILLLVGLAGLQLGVAAYAAQQAGTAARAAARAASDDEEATSPDAAAEAAVSGWVASRSSVSPGGGNGEVTYTVTVEIPSVVPFWNGLGSVTKSATMPLPAEEDE
ncbi:TadE/TadG family type IV pilus assembly protein [Streptomyces bikiniensis]|uniref:TadE/TadG family type IV pilus assembly protein n=1 Tax=Streptomyces bikiniensis TaxID=1896 RepID=UPI0009973326|nr:TadE/TadG family type IV pilus assembly protein [Streptomyces bikiniensis]